jgi:REP element-mobilizing transposase RayT
MRANHVLVADGWHWISTDANNREGVFMLPRAVQLLREVLHDARKIYEFEVRGLRIEADRVSFFINAADGVAVILAVGDSSRKNRSNFEKF